LSTTKGFTGRDFLVHMSNYIKYYNLLIYKPSEFEGKIIGEDPNASLTVNDATIDMDSQELDSYNAQMALITKLSVQNTDLIRLPPGMGMPNLTNLDISNCTRVVEIPPSYTASLSTIKVASTKLSSIPAVYTNITHLDITNCKRISSISISTIETLLMSHSGVTELTSLNNLLRLVALNTKVTYIPAAPQLVVAMWSGSNNIALEFDPACSSLVHVLTTGSVDQIVPPAFGLVTSILM